MAVASRAEKEELEGGLLPALVGKGVPGRGGRFAGAAGCEPDAGEPDAGEPDAEKPVPQLGATIVPRGAS
jgi:hypothetical protein